MIQIAQQARRQAAVVSDAMNEIRRFGFDDPPNELAAL